jgi:lactate permease
MIMEKILAEHGMDYFLAALPILTVLVLMMALRWGGQRAGPLGWLISMGVAALAFGLNFQVWWVSQVKGLILSLFVLAILFPALFLYNVVDQVGGIRSIAGGLERAVGERGMLLILLAWAFSSVLEGLAGFGLPIAVVAPMLVILGINPLSAVAAVAVGHAWSVTFGDVGVVFQTLMTLVNMDAASLAPFSALLLGFSCVLCGLASAFLLGQGRYWPAVVVIGLAMSAVQYLMAVTNLMPLAALGAGITGIAAGILWARLSRRKGAPEHARQLECPRRALLSGLGAYGVLIALVSVLALAQPLNTTLKGIFWQAQFPQVVTQTGFVTPAAGGTIIRYFLHPGSSILLVSIATYLIFRRMGYSKPGDWKAALRATWHSGAPSSLAVISMVGFSSVMDHCGMTLLLAQGLSALMGSVYPLISPLIGILGAFATGSNNNSNVLFAMLQKNAALLLGLDARVLIAAQTTGGALGSMLAPTKLVVGCSTVGLKGRDGEVLRITLPVGLGICVAVGLVAWAMIALF